VTSQPTDRTDGPEPDAVFAPLSRAVRCGGRRRTRALALLSLLVAVGAAVYVLTTQLPTARSQPPLAVATAGAWQATGALSDALRALRPGLPRGPARRLALAAVRATARANRAVSALPATASDVPLYDGTRTALRACRRWAAATAAVLAVPHGPRRATLAALSGDAEQSVSLVARNLPASAGTVGGTSRLLAATR